MEELCRPARVLFSYNPKYFNLKFDMGLGLSFRTNLNVQIDEDIWEEWEQGSEEYRRLMKHYIVRGIRNKVVLVKVIGQPGRQIGVMFIPVIGMSVEGEETFHDSPLFDYSDFLQQGFDNQWNVDRLPAIEDLNLHYHL